MKVTQETIKQLGFKYNEVTTAVFGRAGTHKFWTLEIDDYRFCLLNEMFENRWSVWMINSVMGSGKNLHTMEQLFVEMYELGIADGRTQKTNEIKEIFSIK